MTPLDALLLVVLVPFAVTGWGRGLCREVFGLVGWVAGALAAAAGTAPLVQTFGAPREVPMWAVHAVAFAGLFVVTLVMANVAGIVADRLVRMLLLGPLNRVAGLTFGVAKGAAVLGLGLLLVQRVARSPALTETIADSTLARPLVSLAHHVIEAGRRLTAEPEKRPA